MIRPKAFFALAIPVTFSFYSLLMNLMVPGSSIISLWSSLALAFFFCVISIAVLIKISESEEEKLISDHMNIRQ